VQPYAEGGIGHFYFMKHLILIRHGETQYSAEKRYCGFQDVPLTENGRAQSRLIGRRLKHTTIDAIYSSDLKRCAETANIAFWGKHIFIRKALREIDFGTLAGLRYNDLSKEFPAFYKLWAEHPEELEMPEGERLADFASRIELAFSEIAQKNRNKTVAVVTHGGPIRIMLLKLLGESLDKMWEIEQDVAAINEIEFVRGEPKVLTINDTSHLG